MNKLFLIAEQKTAPAEGRAGGLSHSSCRAKWRNSPNPELVSRLQEAVTGLNCKVQERKKLGGTGVLTASAHGHLG